MVGSNIYQLQKVLNESNIELIFSGTFSQGLIEELGEALKERLLNQKVAKNKLSSAFFAFIEQAQNIRNYLASKENSENFEMIVGSGIIAISKTESGYCVNSGNIIFNDDIEKLEKNLDTIHSMSIEKLNNYYKEKLKNEIDKETGRAGLGLVQIARKSTFPIEYRFERIDQLISFYTLKVTI